MKHLLIDVDSKIPNLALMKISQYFQERGGEVQLYRAQSDPMPEGSFMSVWISCVFTWNAPLARYLQARFEARAISVRVGGSGIDLQTRLPEKIENLKPDYGLYHDDRAIGFIQRGCIRACDFCAVHRKEGWLKDNDYHPLESWMPRDFEKVLLLDNEFAAMSPDVYPKMPSDREAETIEVARANKWKISITQGYDLRCVNDRKAALLASWKPWDLKFTERRLYVAWDYFGIEPFVRRGIERLLNAGFKGREIMCYCLVGHGTSHDEDRYRFELLWGKYGVLPFLMRYRPLDGSPPPKDPWLAAFCRYVNRGPGSYRNHSFEDYLTKRPISERTDEQFF